MHKGPKIVRKAYLSNIGLGWTLEQQEKLLATEAPDWPATLYKDELPARALRARNPDALKERAALVRSSSRRRDDEVIHVVSLGVLAWRQDDFASFIEKLADQRYTLVAHHDAKTFNLAHEKDRRAAVEAFPESRKKGSRQKGRLIGAKRSAEIRNARSREACEKIRERWSLSSELYATADLITETGFSRNTVQRWLGKRPAAQARRLRNLKRAQRIAQEISET